MEVWLLENESNETEEVQRSLVKRNRIFEVTNETKSISITANLEKYSV